MGRLRPVLEALAGAARRFDGNVLRSLGDGLLVVFGAPRAQEGHALLACRAALAMQAAVAGLDRAPVIRVGLHSGEVIAGEIDTGSAIEREALGVTVHIASRIEQLAEPGSICMSDACCQLVRAYCDTSPLGNYTLRGVPDPVDLHALNGLRPAVASEHFRGTRLTSLYGREEPLEMLERALSEAEQGIPGVIGISAAAGIGKSRLCFEFGERCRRRSVYVLEARAFPYGQATALLPIIEMLRTYFRVSAFDEAIETRGKIERRLRVLDTDRLSDAALLFDFLGVRDASEPRPVADPREAQARLRNFLGAMLKTVGREPGVIIIEDLHWLDPASRELIDGLVEAVAGTRILMVVNFRQPFHAEWMTAPHYRELVLGELDDPASGALVRELMGAARDLDQLRTQIVARCAGNPFFAEELVRWLAETGVLEGRLGQYRRGPTAPEVSLPPTVEVAIGARIDRLADNEKALLQIGSIIGKEFAVVVLREVAAHLTANIDALLARLSETGLIQEQSNTLGRGFEFRHPLIQEVAYGMQLRSRRQRLHAEVAKAIEKFEWGRHDEFAGLLSHHYEAAGDFFTAALHLQRSAYWVGRTNSAEALRQWRQVRRLLDDAPPSPTNDRLRAQACGQVLNFGWREGMEPSEAKPYADEAQRFAREVGDTVHGPLLLATYGRIVAISGPADEYVRLTRDALALRANDIDVVRVVMLHGLHAQALLLAGKLREALQTNEAGLGIVAAPGSQVDSDGVGLKIGQIIGFDPGHWLRAQRTRLLVWLGRFDEADAAIAALDGIEATNGQIAVVQFIPQLAALEMAVWRGDAETAERRAAVLADYVDRFPMPYLRVIALVGRGIAKSATGEFAQAQSLLREALDYARHARSGLEYEPLLLSTIADVVWRAGLAVQAAGAAREAIDVAQRRTNRIAELHASLVRAIALVETGAPGTVAQARSLATQAENLFDVTGAAAFKPLLTRARSLIEVSRRSGPDGAESRANLGRPQIPTRHHRGDCHGNDVERQHCAGPARAA